MKEVKAIIQPYMLESVCESLRAIVDLPGISVSQVAGWGKTRDTGTDEMVVEGGCTFARKTKVEITIGDALVDQVVCAIARGAHTGNMGDGKIFISDVADVVKIRTGERGDAAL